MDCCHALKKADMATFGNTVSSQDGHRKTFTQAFEIELEKGMKHLFEIDRA